MLVCEGGSGSHAYLAGQDLTSAEGHQLLLQTVISAQSYPPFALLPLLRGNQKQGRATFWPANHLARRQYHMKPPCFAACPLYAKPQQQPSLTFPMKLPSISPVKISIAPKAPAPSHPLYKYAALGRIQSIQSVPVSAERQGPVTGLHTYAGLAKPMPATSQASYSAQHPRQALKQFAQLDNRAVGQSCRRGLSATAASGREALRSYANLNRHS